MARYVALQDYWNVLADEMLSPARQSAFIAAFAKEKINEVEARQGVLPKDTVVDGVVGAAEERVKPNGIIVYFIHPFYKILKELAETIEVESPWAAKTQSRGGYRDNHFRDEWRILLNGQAYPFGVDFELKPGDEVIIINAMPYARKIERGVNGSMMLGEKQVPVFQNRASYNKVQRRAGLAVMTSGKGELELAAQKFKSKYPRFIKFIFTYIPLPAGITNPTGSYLIPGNRYPALRILIPKNLETGVAS